MGKKALTLDLQTGKKRLETIVDDLTNAAGRDDVAYSAKAVDEKVEAISTTITEAVEAVTVKSSYQNSISGIFKSEASAEASAEDQKRYAIDNRIEVFTAGKPEVGNPGDIDYQPAVEKSWKVITTVEDGTKVVVANSKTISEYIYDSSIGKNGYSGTSWRKFLEDKSLVHTIGTETITGSKTFSSDTTFAKDVIITGDLTVNGTTTTINTTDLNVKDNIILLNDGDAGLAEGGITSGFAGIEINRGETLPKAQLLFTNESEGFKAGVESDLKTIALIDDAVTSSNKDTYSINKINSLISDVTTKISNSTVFSFVAAEDLDVGQVVYLDVNGKAALATSTNDACIDKIVGIVKPIGYWTSLKLLV